MQAYMYMRAGECHHQRILAHTCVRIHAGIHAYIYMHAYTCMHIHACIYMQVRMSTSASSHRVVAHLRCRDLGRGWSTWREVALRMANGWRLIRLGVGRWSGAKVAALVRRWRARCKRRMLLRACMLQLAYGAHVCMCAYVILMYVCVCMYAAAGTRCARTQRVWLSTHLAPRAWAHA